MSQEIPKERECAPLSHKTSKKGKSYGMREYEGEVISLQEADRRKKLYETMGSPFQLMAIESAGHNVAQVFLKELNNNNIYLYQKRKIR